MNKDTTLKYLVTALLILLIWINWFRYHTPLYRDDISLFDYWNSIAFTLLVLITILRPRNLISEMFLVFTAVQAFGSVVDEYLKMASHIGRSDDVWLVSSAIISLIYGVVRYKIRPYPIL